MSKDVDCQIFQDQLEALAGGTLPPDAISQLRSHASACPDCGMQWAVHRHLAEPSLRELESAVPEEHLASIWAGVQAGIAAKERGRARGGARAKVGAGASDRTSQEDGVWRTLNRGPGWSSWLTPTLAAASLALVLVSGFLFSELRKAEANAAALAERLASSPATSSVSQAAAEIGGFSSALQGRSLWLRALSTREEIGIGVLKQMLLDLPGNPTLLDSGQLRDLQRLQPAFMPRFLRDALAELEAGGTLRAQDLIRILNSSGLDPNLTVPTSRLIELLS